MPEVLAEAANTFGEPEAKVREAAQFYVREVLFFHKADAYRVLGVAAEASAEQIKAHHRLLQHWLHPDRLQSEDDAIFATRVNGAWNHLRNPQRRQAYDEMLRQSSPPDVFDSSELPPSTLAWVAIPEFHQSRWQHYLPMLLLSLACLALILLVAHDMERRPEGADWLDHRETASAGAGDMMDISVPLTGGPGGARSKPPKTKQFKQLPGNGRHPHSPTSSQMVDQPANVTSQTTATRLPAHFSRLATQPSAPPITAPQMPPRTNALPSPDQAQPRPLPPASSESTPGFVRIQLARHTGDQFLRYMSKVNRPPPPIWNSPAILLSADNLRHELHEEGRAQLGAAQWRIGNETAVMTYGYTMQRQDAGNGLLTADLLWRNGQWLVIGLSMERAK
ncbi:MAG: DnaJ domain-containing protein [Thermomonas sp.]